MAEWDGVVEASSAHAFWALLQDPTGEQPDLRVEIALEKVPPSQRSIVAPGAHFFLTVEVLGPAESRSTISTITFRPPLEWSKKRRGEIDAQADDIHRAIFG